ncbi:MAG: hypothetical protein R3C08_09210 [Hyphomonas sp.]|nr:hypothetical protein [Hyphomonas sp.]HRX75502.1 hypothetical protein [Hyphomonas sp.]
MIECSAHGSNEETFVCSHILETLQKRIPKGFHWILDHDGCIQAFCDACWNATDEEWAETSATVCRLICLVCLKDAATINGINFDPEPYRNDTGKK